jgi:hypothetical protein
MGIVSKQHLKLGLTAAVVLVAAVGVAAVAPALAQKGGDKARTPQNWSYEIRNGQRIPRAQRVTSPDGSWREELRDGNCMTVRTMSSAGEYRESRQC